MTPPLATLVDLHRHLEGAVRLSTILDLGRSRGIPLPAWTEAGLSRHVCVNEPVPGLVAFLEKFHWIMEVLVDEAACCRTAREAVEDAAAEGVGFLELRFSPLFMSHGAGKRGLEPEAVVDAVISGVSEGAAATGIEVALIGILSRTFGPEKAWKELAALEGRRDAMVGLDLAGDEARWPGHHFVEHFRRARDLGWRVTIHAGESLGPESIWQATRDLGAERIGHAVTATEDPALMDHLAEHGITIEANLTSNVQTGVVASYGDHPALALLEHGVPVTLNTDDPGISRIDLPTELELAVAECGFRPEQVELTQQHARAAWWGGES